jgi:hypothetical protein
MNVTATLESITISMALEKCTFTHKGKPLHVYKLPVSLGFARKPADLKELAGGWPEPVYVFARIEMDPLGFDAFAANLSRDTDWLEGMALALPVEGRACVMVVSTGRPVLFVDTQGYTYARYVARLG